MAASAKSLRKRLQRQLEFYLSASNLRQDKFLRQHMDERGFLPASLFLSFHKVQALRATERVVLEAAHKSDALRVDERHAAIAPTEETLQEIYDDDGAADDRTVYVEGYDADAHDHDSLRKIFAAFGKVTLVSMPRFTSSRKFKGFAFVEFATQDAAREALAATQKRDVENEALRGVKCMSKRTWLDMKDKLKKQLNLSAGEKKAATEKTEQSEKPTTSGHVRFRDEDDEEEEEGERLDNKKQRLNSSTP